MAPALVPMHGQAFKSRTAHTPPLPLRALCVRNLQGRGSRHGAAREADRLISTRTELVGHAWASCDVHVCMLLCRVRLPSLNTCISILLRCTVYLLKYLVHISFSISVSHQSIITPLYQS